MRSTAAGEVRASGFRILKLLLRRSLEDRLRTAKDVSWIKVGSRWNSCTVVFAGVVVLYFSLWNDGLC